MCRIDFREISNENSAIEFERFVADLLKASGWAINQGPGVGPDNRVDIIAEKEDKSLTGKSVTKRYIVDCKHRAHGVENRNVSPRDMGNFQIVPGREYQGWLLVTSSNLTSGLISDIERANSQNPGIEFNYWDKNHLTEFLLQDEYRDVLRQYFPESYKKLTDELVPSIKEIKELCEKWSDERDLNEVFKFDEDDLSRIRANLIRRNLPISELEALLFSNELNEELFSSLQKFAGKLKFDGTLLIASMLSLEKWKRQGLGNDARYKLFVIHVSRSLQGHVAIRQQVQGLLHDGQSFIWESFLISKEKFDLPPLTATIRIGIYCPNRDEVAVGQIRFGDQTVEFATGYQTDFILAIPTGDLTKRDMKVEYKLEEGSNRVCFSLIGVEVFE